MSCLVFLGFWGEKTSKFGTVYWQLMWIRNRVSVLCLILVDEFCGNVAGGRRVCCGAVRLPSLSLTLSAVLQCVHGRLIWVLWCCWGALWRGKFSPLSICWADPYGVQITWLLVCGKDPSSQFNTSVFACHNNKKVSIWSC